MAIMIAPIHSDFFRSPERPLLDEHDFLREIVLVQAHRRKLIARRNLLYSPIAHLPAPVLAKIFDFAQLSDITHWNDVTEGDEWTDISPIPDPRQLIPLMLVSRPWCEIAMNHASLWGFVDTAFWSPYGMRLIFERSKGGPLSCCIRENGLRRAISGSPKDTPYSHNPNKPSRHWSDQDLRYIFGLSGRIRRLELSLKKSTFRRNHQDSATVWIQLQYASFAVVGHVQENEVPFVPQLPVKEAINLRFLALRGLRVDANAKYSFPALRSFSVKKSGKHILEIVLKDLLHFLGSTPLLENLELHGSDQEAAANTDLDTVYVVGLPKLQRLSFQIYRDGRSSLSTLLKYLSIPATCSSRVSLSTSHMWQQASWDEGMEISTDSKLLDMADCLSSCLSPYESLFTPHHVTLAHIHQTDFIVTADKMPPKTPLQSWRVDASIAWSQEDYIWAAGDDLASSNQRWLDRNTRCLEILLPRACSVSSLVTLDCSVQISPSLWISAFGDLASLRNIRLRGETAASHFVDAFVARHETPEHCQTFQILQHIEIDPLPWSSMPYHRIDYGGWASPISAPNLDWVTVLDNLSGALHERCVRQRKAPLAKLTIHREVYGCALNPETMAELLLLGKVSDLVTELILVPYMM